MSSEYIEQLKSDQNPEPSVPDADDFDLILAPSMEEKRGSKPGDVRICMSYSTNPAFRYIKRGIIQSTPVAEKPETEFGRFTRSFKRLLIGVPIASEKAEQERLSKFKALAILSSDAISSVAFATEAILINLIAAGSGNLWITLPISLVIIGLLCIVALSYRQTIPAYPNGGGSYTVARENLGELPGLTAAAALMIDYTLNVAVCVAAGVHNLVSLFDGLAPYIIPLDIALVILITLLNLRGVRESGSIFAFPTYFFIGSALLLIIVGLVKAYVFHHQPVIGTFAHASPIEPLTVFLVLRAFATGCSAMTGVEAISNGVPVFQKPETRNASITLTWMATILGVLFLGITLLTMTYAVSANESGNPTVIAMIAEHVFTGPLVWFFPIFQISVLGILVLSAETSYADFPRLASLLARDRYLPMQFSFRGDRLAFSVGIIVLAIIAAVLLVVFGGDTNLLINLFAVGVFVSFTLSQTGMVVHWWRLRGQAQHWRRSMFINGLGAITTCLVTIIVAAMKFLEGAWIVVLLVPLLVLLFKGIQRHYQHFDQERSYDIPVRPEDIHHIVIVPIDRLDRAAVQSLAYARSISTHVVAVHVMIDESEVQGLQEQWEQWHQKIASTEQINLLIIESPYRSLLRPLISYIEVVRARHPQNTITVILPEFVVSHWWEYFLHNNTALRLKAALLFRPDIVVVNLPQHMSDRHKRQEIDIYK